ncbi:MAG: cbb3-type cytochrome oxidase assembly protein [Planctomycetota bacterium]|nr:cbb3-type cytochrome oxidase assembly protein [Planctomycetota bacterium]
MTALTVYLLLGAVCMGIGGWLVFLLATRTGQWKDMEQVKYQLFEDPEEIE